MIPDNWRSQATTRHSGESLLSDQAAGKVTHTAKPILLGLG
jgi:hypothetical protein